MTYGSVCSGIEAASVAFGPLGWKAAFFSEIDAFPRAVLKHHYPEVKLYGDFRKIEAGSHAIDLLIGGTPCQSFSIAGLRQGLDAATGNLALEYIKLAARLRPRWIVWENVPGLLSIDGGRAFGTFIGGLVECGYSVCWRILDAKNWGVPQRRRRIFVVGYLGTDWRPPCAVLFEPSCLLGNIETRRETRQDVAGALGSRAAAGGGGDGGGARFKQFTHELSPCLAASGRGFERGGDSRGQDAVVACYGGNNQSGAIDVATACNGHGGPPGRMDFETETFVAKVASPLNACNGRRLPGTAIDDVDNLMVTHSMRADGFDASEDGTGRGTPLVVSHTLGTQAQIGPATEDGTGRGAPLVVAIQERAESENPDNGPDGKGFREDGQAYTLEARSVPQAIAFDLRAVASSQSGVRRLTPCECEKLQGFAPGYTQVPYRGKPSADGPRYKSIGNSFAVPVVRWIGERIQMVDEILK